MDYKPNSIKAQLMQEDDIEEIKKKLKFYKAEDIEFNEPHFTQQLILREGGRKEVIRHLLDSESLAYSYPEKGKHGDIKHCPCLR